MANAFPPSIPITVLIFTLNEETHLPSCLQSLCEFDEIIVVDSYSTDHTKEICEKSKVRFFQHSFEGFGKQRNWALQNTSPKYTWVLILDADERVSEELSKEIRGIVESPNPSIAAYRVRRKFYMWGKWLKHSSLYPSWVVRFVHRNRTYYVNRGHSETQEVDGRVAELKGHLIDENLKGINEWFERQYRYSTQEALYELQIKGEVKNGLRDLFSADPMSRRTALKVLASNVPLRPAVYFFYSYVWKKGFLDGKEGFMFCLMKSLYQGMIVIKKYAYQMEHGNVPHS